MNAVNTFFPVPLASALFESTKGYNFRSFTGDLTAGFVVSLIALPLAMALSIAVGLPPQHGIYTAIVAGIITALLGGSRTQVSGPTAAFVVIVAPIVSEFGLHGLIWCQIMAGLFLVVMGTARLGRLINYIPYPVTTGFTAGIAVVIATIALNDFMGLGIEKLEGEFVEKTIDIARHIPSLNAYEFGVGLLTLMVMVFSGRVIRFIPAPVLGIAIGTLAGYFLNKNGIDIDTIGSRFTYETSEGLKHGIPPFPPKFHLPGERGDSLFSIPTYAEFRMLVVPAMVVATLAALESLLSATVADSISGTRHDPNAELNGIGIANVFSALAAGIPATGAIARTAANIHAGAKSPLAATFHAILIMAYVLALAPLINMMPMTCLAALLIITAWRMAHVKQFIRTVRVAPRSDVVVLLTCFFLTVFIDMVAGVMAGIVMASFLFMRHISQLTHVDLNAAEETGNLPPDIHVPDGTMVYRIDGPLFFGTVEKAYDRYNFIHDSINRVVIDVSKVPLIDMTGLVAIESMLQFIAREGREIIICGPERITDKIVGKIPGSHERSLIKIVRDLHHLDFLRKENPDPA